MTLFLMASGVTLVIMMGGIDLSVQAVASMTSCILAVYLPQLGFFAIPCAVLGGVVAGFAGGYVSTRLRIPSFIATLAVSGVGAERRLLVLRNALGQYSGRAQPASISPGRSAISSACRTRSGLAPSSSSCSASFSASRPSAALVRGIGAQERAVIASGIDVDRVKIAAYTLSGTMAGIAGVVMAARLGSGSPTLANEFLLPAIASIVVGGTAITGGVGSVWRTFVGALIVQVVRIGMTFMGVSVFAQQIVFGVILVAAVAVTMDRTKVLVIK